MLDNIRSSLDCIIIAIPARLILGCVKLAKHILTKGPQRVNKTIRCVYSITGYIRHILLTQTKAATVFLGAVNFVNGHI